MEAITTEDEGKHLPLDVGVSTFCFRQDSAGEGDWSVFLEQDGAEAGHGCVNLERDWLLRVEVVESNFS